MNRISPLRIGLNTINISFCSSTESNNNNVLKITVDGNDVSVNADSKTVYTIHFDNTTVGIGSISANEAKKHKVYTIGGVRVNSKPTAGMYIVDGKKTIVK